MKKREIYIFIDRDTKILRSGASASWGLRSIIKYKSRSKQHDIFNISI